MTDMQSVHLAGVDLNLLVALDALLAERSVTRAATRVGLSQSAMSHALARIRALLGDAVLVRTSEGMTPTLRAERLAPALARTLSEVRGLLAGDAPFDPRTSVRTFTIATSDYAELVLLPRLLARLAACAPSVDIWVKSVPDDPIGCLAAGEVDLLITPLRDPARTGVIHERLFDERFVCVVRRDHPLAKKRLTLARFLSLPHALVAPRGQRGGFVDDALAALGERRRVACTVPHFLVAPYVVVSTDMILTLAERVARTFAAQLPLAILAPPLELPGFTMSQTWHERSANDEGHAWLRSLLLEVAVSG